MASNRDQNRQMNEPSPDECTRRLQALSAAAIDVTSELALDKVLQRIVDSARDLSNARYAALGVIDEERQQLAAFLVSGFTRREIKAIGQWPRGLGLLGLLLREPRPIRIKEIAKDPRSVGFPPNHPRMTSFLGVPVTSKGHILGNFYITDKIGKDEFSQEDEELLVIFAAHAAVAIENARLYTQVNMTLQEKIREVEHLAEEAQGRAAQLDAANKELEAFAYSVSHDLRAPLRHIDGFSQALEEDYVDQLDEPGKEYIQFIRGATKTMGQLIDDLLKLSRVTRAELRREPINLSKLAQSIAAELRKEQPERQVEFVIASEVTANGDSHLLRIVLENLLGNAWKFTSKRPVARIEFGIARHNGKPAYYVRDNGAGFDMAYASKLFGAFQRLHKEEEFVGTGIGLATVHRIIQRHGGRVWAEGAIDKGATFYFTVS